MGTVFSFRIEGARCSATELADALDAACRELHRLDELFSTWKSESPMSLLRCGQLGLDEVPAEIPVVLELCGQARRLTAGWFDPWSLPGGVDPTGLVKGWAAEQALKVLTGAGVTAGLVNAGGDVATVGQPVEGDAWPIGIRHPWRPDALACILKVGGAVATSGRYERGEHLIDPMRGVPAAAEVASASVTGQSLAMADAFATALAVGGMAVFELLRDLEGYEAYVIAADGSEESTEGIVFA